MDMIAFFLHRILGLYSFVIIVGIILSWLIAFGVVNRSNQFVAMIDHFCHALTEPVLRPIRNFLPNMGGIDISPLIAIIGIQTLQYGITRYLL